MNHVLGSEYPMIIRLRIESHDMMTGHLFFLLHLVSLPTWQAFDGFVSRVGLAVVYYVL